MASINLGIEPTPTPTPTVDLSKIEKSLDKITICLNNGIEVADRNTYVRYLATQLYINTSFTIDNRSVKDIAKDCIKKANVMADILFGPQKSKIIKK